MIENNDIENIITDIKKQYLQQEKMLQKKSNFYLKYPIVQTLSGQLSWSHYCELLSISDESKRSFYEKEAIIKDPYVFEFLGIPENKPLLEKDLEYKLIRHKLLKQGNGQELMDY